MPLPKIEISDRADAEALALGWFAEDGKDKKAAAPRYGGKSTKDVEKISARLSASKHFFGKKGEADLLRYFEYGGYANTLLLGLGSPKKWSTEMSRQAGAALFLAQKRARLNSVALQADSIFAKLEGAELAHYVQAFCEGYFLAGYEFRDLKKQDNELFAPKRMELVGVSKTKVAADAVKRAGILAEAVNFARSLGDKPGNVLTPTEFGRLAEQMARAHGLHCTILDKAGIERERMGLFLGVAKGSDEEPRFIILEHRGGKKNEKPIMLVGKGITFDSGGISLKPAHRMEDMKYDMMGAAAVAGIMQAVADLELPFNITGLIATTENMPDGRAQKPGDVARSMSGKTVEIINTDAEGRLILADAIEFAQKREPQALIDFATLTGAVVDALGTVTSGIMGNHPGLIQRVKEASAATNERVWELPLYEEYEDDLRSSVADIKNSGIREAGSSKGGTFLKFFVEPTTPWVHCDIAGSAYHRKDVNYHPQKYGAGVMVRLMAHLLEHWKPLK